MTTTPTNDKELDELKQQITKCFIDTLMEREGDLELFDTDVTIDNIATLITSKVEEAEKQLVDRVLAGLPKQKYTLEQIAASNSHLDSRHQQSLLDESRGWIKGVYQTTKSIKAALQNQQPDVNKTTHSVDIEAVNVNEKQPEKRVE